MSECHAHASDLRSLASVSHRPIGISGRQTTDTTVAGRPPLTAASQLVHQVGWPVSVPLLIGLQRAAGNRAVVALVQRQSVAVQGQRAGPEMRAGKGTTPELQAERLRLDSERTTLHVSTIEPETEMLYNRYTSSLGRLDVLLAERGNSTLTDADIQLNFDGQALSMSGGSSGTWAGVSGRPDASGGFDYSPARQRMLDVGPIPAGGYWLDPSQLVDLRQRWLYSWRYETAWGTHRITIHPFDTTHTFGRGGFFIHGGTSPGSAGCIDLTTNMAALASRLAATPPARKVKLTVSYPP